LSKILHNCAASFDTRALNNNNSEIARKAGIISMQKYKNDPERQKLHSERMQIWWNERRKIGT
jgi:hypothetical protein